MSVSHQLENYIQTLQELLQQPNDTALLEQAKKLWGVNDSRYLVLEVFAESALPTPTKKFRSAQLLSSEGFDKPAPPPGPEDEGTVEDNKPVR